MQANTYVSFAHSLPRVSMALQSIFQNNIPPTRLFYRKGVYLIFSFGKLPNKIWGSS